MEESKNVLNIIELQKTNRNLYTFGYFLVNMIKIKSMYQPGGDT